MIDFENDAYIKSYVREINGRNVGPLELKYTKVNSQVPKSLKNTKFITNSLDVNNGIRYLEPEINCNPDSKICSKIDNIIKEIEQDIRQRIVFYNPVKFQINFGELDNIYAYDNEIHLGSTEISAYYCLSTEESPIKYSYPQSLVKQSITNNVIEYTTYDFVITLNEDESSYIVNASELASKSSGYDLKLILYHEIIHGLGVNSEAIGYPDYLSTYDNVQPSDYTSFVGDQSYLIILLEPTIYDSFIYNENVDVKSLGEKLQPMSERLPVIRDKLGSLPTEKQNLYAFTKLVSEEIEGNCTVVAGAIKGYAMVTHEGIYFKGNSYSIPLYYTNEFKRGISITHTKHYENEVEGDKVLLDWSISNGKIFTDTKIMNKKQQGIMGPEITDMLHTLGWPTVDDMKQKSYKLEESVKLFSRIDNSGATISFTFNTIFILFILILMLWH